MEMTEPIRAYIAAARVCRIATVRPDGEPHIIPVCPVFDGDTTVYVDLGPKSVTARALRRDPRIAVIIDDYDEDWTKLRKVILNCRAETATPAEAARAWELIRVKFTQYGSVGWEPRSTMALRIHDWVQEGTFA
jgi:PPOX class probable F420-dependent enzyme